MHYIPLYEHPFFKKRGAYQPILLPEMDLYYQQALSLPLYFDLKEQDVTRVCKELKAVLSKKGTSTAKN